MPQWVTMSSLWSPLIDNYSLKPASTGTTVAIVSVHDSILLVEDTIAFAGSCFANAPEAFLKERCINQSKQSDELEGCRYINLPPCCLFETNRHDLTNDKLDKIPRHDWSKLVQLAISAFPISRKHGNCFGMYLSSVLEYFVNTPVDDCWESGVMHPYLTYTFLEATLRCWGLGVLVLVLAGILPLSRQFVFDCISLRLNENEGPEAGR